MVVGLREFNQRIGAGAPLLDAENGEDLMHVQSGVSIVLDGRSPEHPGTLYISTQKVIWLSDVDPNKGYAVDFLSVSLHAVSRDPEAYPFPCIYTQIETGDEEEDESDGSDAENVEALDLSRVREMRLIPSDPEQLDTLFEIFCECAELNPEPSDEEESGEHNWVFSADMINNDAEEGDDPAWDSSANMASSIGHSNGNHDLSRNVLELHINDQRFDDAEEMERDSNGDHV
ncbi:hypothetical protein MLD38_002259 [Melastoma candidum]|uniref:Uncharacterized protein n=1 Tax=Melastoma candidum TaxID=119954 RepID=A0ACB9SHH0_9MYRT|nr:hypothetical protein MLD38_002259 [Melastoma candidum]